MSFFCPKCGTQLPDGATVCTNCSTPIGAAPQAPVAPAAAPAPAAPQQAPQAFDPNAQYAQQPYPQQPYPQQGYPQAPYGAPVAAPKQPANFDLNVGGFFGDFFKSPIDAVNSRAEKKFWLMGLIFAGAFALLNFILALIEYKYKKAQTGFAFLFTDICAIALFVIAVMLFPSVFKVKKMDFLSSLALTGLPFAMFFACKLLSYLNDKIMNAADKNYKFISISNAIWMIAFFFVVICLYEFAKTANPTISKTSALLFAVLSVVCFMVATDFCKWLFCKMFDLPNYAANMSAAFTESINSMSKYL